MNGDDMDGGQVSDEQEITLTFSYDPVATLEELFGLREETLFQAFELALEQVGVRESVEVSVLITTDEGIRALNREYRGKDEATDVLSFPLLDQPIVEAPADQLWPSADTEDADDAELDDLDALDDLDDLDGLDDLSDLDAERPDAQSIANGHTNGHTDAEGAADQRLEDLLVDPDNDSVEDETFDDTSDDDDVDDDESVVWPTHLGDIAIARETALRQAQAAGHSAAYEVAFLFVHGVLHLVGFDDHTDAGYQAMVAHQEAALAQAGVTRD
ncbi:MAG TPA: rRNA maturation RNase YbeY [Ktedonobacterales bacterium]|nr:rRNA maturation RNase YbeY [Ktedonobacterales bacterium]